MEPIKTDFSYKKYGDDDRDVVMLTFDPNDLNVAPTNVMRCSDLMIEQLYQNKVHLHPNGHRVTASSGLIISTCGINVKRDADDKNIGLRTNRILMRVKSGLEHGDSRSGMVYSGTIPVCLIGLLDGIVPEQTKTDDIGRKIDLAVVTPISRFMQEYQHVFEKVKHEKEQDEKARYYVQEKEDDSCCIQ